MLSILRKGSPLPTEVRFCFKIDAVDQNIICGVTLQRNRSLQVRGAPGEHGLDHFIIKEGTRTQSTVRRAQREDRGLEADALSAWTVT